MTQRPLKWAAAGDINAFFGLMLDNVADLLLTVGLLSTVFNFPPDFALRYMVPGTAIGVLVGDLLFFWMALHLARQTGRSDVTAMPLGLDTPSTFGMVFFVLGPSFSEASKHLNSHEAAVHTWHIGICAIFISGIFKFLCASASSWIRRQVPRAGLLGSLAAIALVIISFLPLLEILHLPVIGLVALSIVLTTLVARIPFPFRIPGALAALLISGTMYYALSALHLLETVPTAGIDAQGALLPTEWMAAFRFEWLSAMRDVLPFLPIIIPLALQTVVGGIDCTESAAAAGDEYDTGRVIAVEAFATLVASLCGGVIQTTPYIGHPAYKVMGGRSAYTLVTALFIGAAGLIGFFAYLYVAIPKPTVFPILIFIGLEITSQSFYAVPRRHYAAVAFACVPALAFLGLNFANRVMSDQGLLSLDRINDPSLRADLLTMRILSNGFIFTSLLWAASLTAIIDRRLKLAAGCFFTAAIFTMFGVIHSPFVAGNVFLPWSIEAGDFRIIAEYAAGYASVAVLLLIWDWYLQWANVPVAKWEEAEGE